MACSCCSNNDFSSPLPLCSSGFLPQLHAQHSRMVSIHSSLSSTLCSDSHIFKVTSVRKICHHSGQPANKAECCGLNYATVHRNSFIAIWSRLELRKPKGNCTSSVFFSLLCAKLFWPSDHPFQPRHECDLDQKPICRDHLCIKGAFNQYLNSTYNFPGIVVSPLNVLGDLICTITSSVGALIIQILSEETEAEEDK